MSCGVKIREESTYFFKYQLNLLEMVAFWPVTTRGQRFAVTSHHDNPALSEFSVLRTFLSISSSSSSCRLRTD